MLRRLLRSIPTRTLVTGTEQYSIYSIGRLSRCLQQTSNTNRDVNSLRMHSSLSSNDPPDNKTLLDLLDQLSTSEKFDDNLDYGEDNLYGKDLDDFGQETDLPLPGHRIRGILVPTPETHSAMIADQRYDELPIAYIQASYQNTIITISNHAGVLISKTSGGSVGFKNAKKKTNVAAQAAGLVASQRATAKGVTHVRVSLKGIGKGRLAACKGLEEGGLTLVSLTDVTRIDFGTNMPKKQRRI